MGPRSVNVLNFLVLLQICWGDQNDSTTAVPEINLLHDVMVFPATAEVDCEGTLVRQLGDKRVELAAAKEKYNAQILLQTAHYESKIESLKVQEKLVVANFEERIKSLRLENALLVQNCELRTLLNSVNITNVYQECQARLQNCQMNKEPSVQCRNAAAIPPATSEAEDLLQPKTRLALVTLPTGKYYFSTVKVNWWLAMKLCKSNGLELVSVETLEENHALINVLSDVQSDRFWSSGTDQGSEGEFYWAGSGKPFELVMDWSPRQPDNARGKEHCVELRPNFEPGNTSTLSWNDHICEKLNRFVCELAK